MSCYQRAVKQLKELTDTANPPSFYGDRVLDASPLETPFWHHRAQEYCPLGLAELQVIPGGNSLCGKAERLGLLRQVNLTDLEVKSSKEGQIQVMLMSNTHPNEHIR